MRGKTGRKTIDVRSREEPLDLFADSSLWSITVINKYYSHARQVVAGTCKFSLSFYSFFLVRFLSCTALF